MAEVRPEGPLHHARFGGVLEGRLRDPSALEQAARAVEELQLAPAELELEGGRYSLLLGDEIVPGARVTDEALTDFVARLNALVEASGEPASAESTLRCVEVFPTAVRETLFVARDGRIHSLSRVRPLAEEEASSPSERASELRRLGARKGALIALLLLVGFGLMAWRSGYIDRILSLSAERIELATGPFADDLSLTVERSWGNYVVHIRRGVGFPSDPAEFERRRKQAEDLARLAALEILVGGGTAYVQLCAEDGEILDAVAVDLLPLLSDPKAVVKVELPGRIRAHTIRLSLERGTEK